MAKEKIKVSFLIDKQAVLNCAFRNCKSEEEYKQVKEIIEAKDEIVRDVEKFSDNEEEVTEMTKFFASIGVDEVVWQNKDLAISKRLEDENKHDEEQDNNDGDDNGENLSVVKISGNKAKEILKSLLDGKED